MADEVVSGSEQGTAPIGSVTRIRVPAMFNLAVDAMGGDDAPGIVVDGLDIAVERHPGAKFLLIGDEALLAPLLAKRKRAAAACTVRHSPDKIGGDIKIAQAMRMRGASMRMAIDAVASGEASGVVSAGNTGALMALAKVVMKTMSGIDRPAMAAIGPTARGDVVLLDLGANVQCDARNLVEFAVMGDVFARTVLGLTAPTIGLLSNGSEEMKGDDRLRGAAETLRLSHIAPQFYGFVEGHDIAAGTTDVIVTDGFTGNVALKTAEGALKLATQLLRQVFSSSLPAKLGYLLARPGLDRMREWLDPRRYNGAVMLGLNGVVVKSHGGTDAQGFAYAVDVAMDMVVHRFNEKIRDGLQRLAEMKPAESKTADSKAAAMKDGPGSGPGNETDMEALSRPLAKARNPGQSLPRRSLIAGIGAYLPELVVTNEELAKTVETSDDWIRERTGIRQRHIAGKHETCAFMATHAAQAALADAGFQAKDVDAIIVGTATPDEAFPSVAVRVHGALGMKARGFGFDVSAACSGFIYAMSVADAQIRSGQIDSALVIGSEVYSRIMNWQDRGTCVLFGDGAGAVLLRAAECGDGGSDADTARGRAAGILSTHLHCDGSQGDILYVDGAVGQPERSGHLVMNGREVFRQAVHRLVDSVEEALAHNGLTRDDVDWLVPHQANARIIDGVGKRLGLGPDQVIVTVDRHANTSAASIPLALADGWADGRIKRGQLLLMEALGGGLTWGSALVRM